MPIYKYLCTNSKRDKTTGEKCEHEYDVLYQNHAAVEREEPTEPCPKCGSKKKKRLVNTGTSFMLKGSWYKQGY